LTPALIAPHAPEQSMEPILEARGLVKRYGGVSALEGLRLSVQRGEVYGFLGKNGAGKSTTIRILMGITQADRGEVRIFGEVARGAHVKLRERIGYVAQEQTFYGWMSARRLGSFAGAFYPTWSASEFEQRCRQLEVPLDRKVQTLSGGMRVKLALALALSHRPPLLILDEPTAGLDPVARREFLEIVRADARQTGRTTFFSTHLIDEVERVASRVGIVDGGRMRYEGSVEALAGLVRLVPGVPSGAPLPMELSPPPEGIHVHSDRDLGDGERRVVLVADSPDLWPSLGALPLAQLPLEEIFIEMVRHSARQV
jgi:ABC-2 type transport system ATP-binding protein